MKPDILLKTPSWLTGHSPHWGAGREEGSEPDHPNAFDALFLLCDGIEKKTRKEEIRPKPPGFLSSPDVYLQNSTHIQFMLFFFFLGLWVQAEEAG